ncbi:MAG: class I SAM-dependent methyltransferase [Magnetococcales bacterium]|nr:class I SAM-dependent methyltransferase [Magnetococcales bacterium]
MIFQPDTRHTLGLITRHLRPEHALMDVGCGSGDVAHHLQRLGYPAIFAADRGDFRRHPLHRFALYDGVQLPFQSNGVDMVSLNFVLHHVPNERKPVLLAEAARVSRRHLFILEDTPIHAVDRWLSQRHGENYRRKINSKADFGFYDHAQWLALFQSMGLEVVEAQPLSRFCRNWLQPFARSFFLLKAG